MMQNVICAWQCSTIIVFTVIIVTCVTPRDLRVGDHPFHWADKPSSLDELPNRSIQCQLNTCSTEAVVKHVTCIVSLNLNKVKQFVVYK